MDKKYFGKEDNSNCTQALFSRMINKPSPERLLDEDLARERVEPYVVDMTKELPDVEPLVCIDGSCVCSRGNISAVCGEAKSRKTFLTSALVASAMAMPAERINNFKNIYNNMYLNVLWIDTEQGEMHVRRVIQRIAHMTGATLGGSTFEPHLTTLALRELAPHQRKAMLYDALLVGYYDIVVIDGIADLQRNTNDLEESDALVAELMALSTHTNTHIICVLHTNPGSDKARGHLGSSLQRKAETVLFVHRVGDCSVVEPQFCRNEPFERFAFAINEEGIPELCDVPHNEDQRNDIVAMVADVYGGAIERATLISKLVETKGLKRTTAQMKIKRLIDRELLVSDGNLVRLPTVDTTSSSDGTLSRCHNVTGGGGSVTSVTDVTRSGDTSKTADNQDCNICHTLTHPCDSVTSVTTTTEADRSVPSRTPTVDEILARWAANGVDIKRPYVEDDDECPF